MTVSLYTIYTRLRQHFGPMPNWWPIFGEDAPFEMLLGAVLVQQTRWESVEQAILNLHTAHLLSPAALTQTSPVSLIDLLRPVAFYRQKATGIITISSYLCTHYAGSTATLLDQSTALLRCELLALPRIGPETADVILLYAGKHPVFVVDEYTRRVLDRVSPTTRFDDGAAPNWTRTRYNAVQEQIIHNLTPGNGEDIQQLYATYHALINEHCVRYCTARRPRCDGPPGRRVYSVQKGRESFLDRHDGCPLRDVCAFYQQQQSPTGTND